MDIQQLTKTAQTIRDEKQRYANTATRVGGLLTDMCTMLGDTKDKLNTTATTATADHTIVSGLDQWLTTHDNLGSIAELNTALNAMNADSPQGLHRMKCMGIPVITLFGVLNKDSKVYMQMVAGSFTLSTDRKLLSTINTTTSKQYMLMRYYTGGAWAAWKAFVPTGQLSTQGDSSAYIYSTGDDQSTYTAITSKFWTYTHNDGHLFLRFKHWGGANDTNFTNASQVRLPQVWGGGDGVLHRAVYQRIDAFSMREENSTTTAVNIITPIFTTGGTRSFTISAATTAKAGCMTTAHVQTLSNISTAVANKGGTYLMASGQKVIVTNSDVVGEEVTLADFNAAAATTYKAGDKINIYQTPGAYGVTSGKYMIWFGRRVEEESSSKGALLKYDFQAIAGITPQELFNQTAAVKSLYFMTTLGYRSADKGSSGFTISASTSVPYIPSTDDKILLDKIKQKLGL